MAETELALVTRHSLGPFVQGNPNRVVLKRFFPSSLSIAARIACRVLLDTSSDDAAQEVEKIRSLFYHRHQLSETDRFMLLRGVEVMERIRKYLVSHPSEEVDSREQLEAKLTTLLTEESSTPNKDNYTILLASFFVHEYAIETAALFNPSIVPFNGPPPPYSPSSTTSSPSRGEDKSGGENDDNQQRCIMSLRSCGEGHISSISFQEVILENVVQEDGDDEISDSNLAIRLVPQAEKRLSVGVVETQADRDSKISSSTLPNIPYFNPITGHEFNVSNEVTNFTLRFDPSVTDVSQRVIFPSAPCQANGMEDARFVCFRSDDQEVTYYATFTAYDGKAILPQMLATKDFASFDVVAMTGTQICNKGMALFPRKVSNGRFAMLSRQDDETIRIMYSHPEAKTPFHDWNESVPILKAEQIWESFKMGNCGSPIETPAGWIVITHGVGPMRRYCLGAALLDLNDPSKVIARLKDPLIAPTEAEREGYVPNVVYSCGAMLHDNTLVIPYAMSDSRCAFASISLPALLKAFEASKR